MKHENGKKFDPERSPKTLAYVIEHDTFNRRCNRCGCPVLKSDTAGYVYQCMNCDEDLYSIEAHKGEYHNDEEFNQLCLDTEALLLLDEPSNEEKLLELRHLQCAYAASLGGLLCLSEADEVWNGYNRKIIKQYFKVHPNCRLGSFNKTFTEPYVGQKIYNFGYDFIVPEEDKTLSALLAGRLIDGHTDMASIMKIQNRIKATGGVVFIWE